MFQLADINHNWTLFLDRDGVINEDKSPYTLNAEMFEFYTGVPEAISNLAKLFKHIIVVTNQRGVGREMMTEDDLQLIHKKMVDGIEAAGGRIDKIFYCTALDNSHPDRKPNPGMALKAFRQFPDAVPANSVMVGNNISDMEFGRNAGMNTVLVSTTGTHVHLPHPLVDYQYNTLPDFAKAVLTAHP